MAQTGPLPPVYRIPPALPGSGVGQSREAPQRKPDADPERRDEERRRRRNDDDDAHVDEYA
ncbi:MAG: hypothetical protein RQ736_10460 [Thiogranum sp.]|nr:hypothetical protein [Thiogranum sp.]